MAEMTRQEKWQMTDEPDGSQMMDELQGCRLQKELNGSRGKQLITDDDSGSGKRYMGRDVESVKWHKERVIGNYHW